MGHMKGLYVTINCRNRKFSNPYTCCDALMHLLCSHAAKQGMTCWKRSVHSVNCLSTNDNEAHKSGHLLNSLWQQKIWQKASSAVSLYKVSMITGSAGLAQMECSDLFHFNIQVLILAWPTAVHRLCFPSCCRPDLDPEELISSRYEQLLHASLLLGLWLLCRSLHV